MEISLSDLTRKASELINQRPTMPVRQRPVRQLAAIWFVTGAATAAAVGFFFDSKEGGARRQLVVDKVRSAGRGMGSWTGGKARHMRNKAMGTVSQMRRPDDAERIAGSL